MKTTLIELTVHKKEFEEALRNFELLEEQKEFSAMPMDKINSPKVEADAVHVVILKDEVPVGYFTLETGDKRALYTSNKQARVLTSFSVTLPYQGKGIAKTALQMLPMFIRSTLPEVNEVVLGVNKRNVAAHGLYVACGFQDHLEEFVGPKGPQNVLHLDV
ncbi:GNAT family N-acetyltransferase [Paenalkalicoccus suaedae]|uniref:GNAT family N-acetyltransferase n=1 Tax=Paenalkalicoccus suaedae TaxID=2592382 RepID=A0A859FBB4_9BACI|nr:GNAT family N-acetyltransferase [Paenalkalicoccus suaedae]QKS69961.1 GNAT family N-acetyltransferase [Paenalkalicoccus suaedae]